MRRLQAILLVAGLLAGCRGLPPEPPASSLETRRLRAEPDRVWAAAQEIVAEQGYTIRRLDRGASVLETEWFPINPDYSANLLVTAQEDRYSECAPPRLGQAFRGKDARQIGRAHV